MKIEVAKREVFESSLNEKVMLEAAKAKLEVVENQVRVVTELFNVGQASESSRQEANLQRMAAISEVNAIESKLKEKEKQLIVFNETIRLAELHVKLADVELNQLERRLARIDTSCILN